MKEPIEYKKWFKSNLESLTGQTLVLVHLDLIIGLPSVFSIKVKRGLFMLLRLYHSPENPIQFDLSLY